MVTEDATGLVNLVDDNGYSPLLLICRNNKSKSLLKCIKAMTKENQIKRDGKAVITNVNYQDRKGFNALHYVCMNYKEGDLFEIINLLTDCKIDPNATDREFDRNALQLLFENSGRESNLLLSFRAMADLRVNLMHKDTNGSTSLHYLCRYYGQDNLVHLLLMMIENGVDVNGKNSENWTALLILCRYYNRDNLIDLVQLVITKGVEINAKTSDGWTALLLLCRYYNRDSLIDLVQLLIKKGVDINAKTTDGRTAMHLLGRHYSHDNLAHLIQLLIQNGIAINANNINISRDNLPEIVKMFEKQQDDDFEAQTLSEVSSKFYSVHGTVSNSNQHLEGNTATSSMLDYLTSTALGITVVGVTAGAVLTASRQALTPATGEPIHNLLAMGVTETAVAAVTAASYACSMM